MQLKTIGAEWKKWKEGKDESWIYDEGYTFLENMSRGDICSMLDQIEAITQDRSDIRAVLKDWISKHEKELSDPYPFDSKYSYCDFVSASDLEEFIDTLLPGDVSK